MQTEGGVTQISLDNARELIAARGVPSSVTLSWDDKVWYQVTATWPDGFSHVFTGFAWGYRGEGPRGLETFSYMIGANIPLEAICLWPEQEPPANGGF